MPKFPSLCVQSERESAWDEKESVSLLVFTHAPGLYHHWTMHSHNHRNILNYSLCLHIQSMHFFLIFCELQIVIYSTNEGGTQFSQFPACEWTLLASNSMFENTFWCFSTKYTKVAIPASYISPPSSVIRSACPSLIFCMQSMALLPWTQLACKVMLSSLDTFFNAYTKSWHFCCSKALIVHHRIWVTWESPNEK